MSEADQIAASLSWAEQEAVLMWEGDFPDERVGRLTDIISRENLERLQALKLVTKPSVHKRIISRLTTLGTEVRNVLLSSLKGEG